MSNIDALMHDLFGDSSDDDGEKPKKVNIQQGNRRTTGAFVADNLEAIGGGRGVVASCDLNSGFLVLGNHISTLLLGNFAV